MKKKISLILEGGGMRGAYTAGALCWLLDEGIEFDAGYGISVGAVHLASFLMKRKDYLYDMSTKYIASKEVVGLRAFLREGQVVAYDYLFKKILKEQLGFEVETLKNDKVGRIGLYDLDKGKPDYYTFDKVNLDMLKAACSLPLIGKVVKTGGKKLLDAGILEMIPIRQAIEDGNDIHLVITTKPEGFTRKPASPLVVKLMKWRYPNCVAISKDYAQRHINYQKQIEMIEGKEKEGNLFYRYPSKTINVSRMRGKPEDLKALFKLGYQDMEDSREEIYRLLKKCEN